MRSDSLIFNPSLEEYRKTIKWDLLDDDLKNSAMSFYEKYNRSQAPVAVWKFCRVEKKDDKCLIEGYKFCGKAFSMIQDGQTVAVYIASCGNLDGNSYSDPLESFFSETLKRQACEQALQYCNQKVSETLGSGICSINPGSGNPDLWPFEQLRGLFEILKSDNLPVRILPSGLMFPVKSVAGLFFHHEGKYRNCFFCARENCPDRVLD